MNNDILRDFIFETKAEKDTINKYGKLLPEQLLEIWAEYGFGSFLNKYLKVINPDEYTELLKATYFGGAESIPIFATGMGDIITFEKNKYIRLVNYRKGMMMGLIADFELFLSLCEDTSFLQKGMDCTPFFEAIKSVGDISYDECFGYVPLLGLGGSEKVENLQIVKLKEHIHLISQLVGPVNNVHNRA